MRKSEWLMEAGGSSGRFFLTSPLSFFKASSASRVSENETNAKPLDLPVSLSMMIFASVTVPKRPKASFKSSSVV